MSQTFVLRKDHPLRDSVYRNMLAYVQQMYESGRDIKADFSAYKNTRSNAQNHALFGVAYPALEESTGHTKDELHEAFCRRFFGTVERDVGGFVISRPHRTTTTDHEGKRDVIDTITFSNFYEMVKQVGAEAGIKVPDPDPFYGMQQEN